MNTNRIVVRLALLLALSVSAAAAPGALPAATAAAPPSLPQPAALAVHKAVSKSQANWNETLAYTITLTNNSVVSPLTTLLTDTLPLSLALDPISLSASEGTVTHTAQV